MGVFLVSQSESFARSLARYLSGHRRAALIGAAPSLALASIMLPALKPDLVLLEWALLAAPPPSAVRTLRDHLPRMKIVAVVPNRDVYVAAAKATGADDVISTLGFAAEFEAMLRNRFPGRFR